MLLAAPSEIGLLMMFLSFIFVIVVFLAARMTSLHKKVDTILANQNGGDDTDASGSE